MIEDYAKILEDGTLKYAPGKPGYRNLSADRYRSHGYLPVASRPRPDTHRDGYHWELGSWEAVDGEITRPWNEVPDPPPPPRTFSKYKLVSALIAADIWPKVKAWIESVPGAYDLYLAAEDISEDEPLLAQGIAAVKELLGWSDKQVTAVLDAAVVGGGA